MGSELKYRDGLKAEVADVKKAEFKLPPKLEQLYEQFCEVDTVAQRRFTKGAFTLEDVRKSRAKAESNLPKITEETIGRILHLYPASFAVKRVEEKSLLPASKMQYVLKIRATISNDLDGYYEEQPCLPLSPKKGEPRPMSVPAGLVSPVKGARKQPNLDYIPKSPTKSPVKPQMRPACAPDRLYFQPWRRECRALIFKYKLYEYLRAEHAKFLREQGIETNNNEDGRPIRFHREFEAAAIAPVPSAPLPVPPKALAQKSMMDYLKPVTPSKQVTPPPKPLGPRAQMRQLAAATKAPIKSPPAAVKLTPRSREKLQFERLLLKQEKRAAEEAARDPEAERRAALLEKLHTRVLPLLSSQYGAKRVSCGMAALCKTLQNSLSTLHEAEFKEMAALLTEVTPTHFSIRRMFGKEYLQLSSASAAAFDEIPKLVEAELTAVRAKLDTLKP
ncbi:hypothetical protein M3Y99_00660600 [Aphelenchoides fujianensis]|nr:hypothetical protein M3Y99_00660600 [Aphelenchoides fujianensis]